MSPLLLVSDQPVKHGYTAADLERMARSCAWGQRGRSRGSLNADDRYELAWFGMSELLCSRGEPPSPAELYAAGWDAIDAEAKREYHHRGVDTNRGGWTPGGTMQAFARYWISPRSWWEPEYVTALVDAMALEKIFAELTSAERQALLALAAFGDQAQAAAELGISKPALGARLTTARRAVLQLWHEHETPPALAPWARWESRAARRTLRPRVAEVLSEAELATVFLPHVRRITQQWARQSPQLGQGARLLRDRIRGQDLRERLVLAHPQLYGRWELADLAQALAWCGVPRRTFQYGKDAQGRRLHSSGYLLADVEAAGEPTAAATGDDPAVVALRAMLEREQSASRTAPPTRRPRRVSTAAPQWRTRRQDRDRMRGEALALIAQAGPAGIRPAQVRQQLPGVSERTLKFWLAQEIDKGTVVRISKGVYAPAPAVPASTAA